MRDKDGIIFDPIAPRAGERLTATCTVVGLTPTDKRNRMNDGKNFTIAMDNAVFQFNQPVPRLYASHQIDTSDWYLTFTPLDRDDIGNLTCALADTNNREIFLTRFLNVNSEPVVLESSTKDTEVMEGQTVVLTCNAQGYPTPKIEWQRADGKPLSSGEIRQVGTQLQLNHVTRADGGIYKCLANNLVGFGAEWTLKLSVRFKPYIYCQKDVGQAAQFQVDAYVECYVYGYPAPRISWIKSNSAGSTINGTNVNYEGVIWNSNKYRIEAIIPEMSLCTDCILSRLTIINVEAGDYGLYFINATTSGFKTELGQVELYETTECQQFITHLGNSGCKRSKARNDANKQNVYARKSMVFSTLFLFLVSFNFPF
ncbi:unnamed protein product [Didymodactylos carnosus]|uniref:Ig-like domain-containing protein n=1 Tax=Didymodactylos carnosus TaxID=1234261 RepID=A0A813PD63_9BILA|nr:unnamed protein product [Didymodactylos carnosus]CAF1260812.1 unnamed protein product [Didymodactylos carnosus]CAF3526060.1 unnamed protein product [Didymodactylos carnosus]CAF4067403.1 unnamed protein product [Didymodactylos carnosus]